MKNRDLYVSMLDRLQAQGFDFREADRLVDFIIKKCDAYALALRNGQIEYALEARRYMKELKKKQKEEKLNKE